MRVVRRLGEGGFGVVELVEVCRLIDSILNTYVVMDPFRIGTGLRHRRAICAKAAHVRRPARAAGRRARDRDIQAVQLPVCHACTQINQLS